MTTEKKLGGGKYVSPAVTTVEVVSESVLCASNFTSGNEDYDFVEWPDGEGWL